MKTIRHWINQLFAKKQAAAAETRPAESPLTRQPVDPPPVNPPPVNPQPAAPDPMIRVRNAIERLNYVHHNPVQQRAKRLEACEQLMALGKAAESAIPELIRKQFSEDADERGRARAALERIDPQWPENALAAETIPYLIGKLKKEQWAVQQAMRLLETLGLPAVEPLLEVLTTDDDFLKANVLQLLGKIGAPAGRLYPHIRQILDQSASTHLLATAAELAYQTGVPDPEMAESLGKLLRHGDAKVRVKAIRALSRATGSLEATVPPLVHCLSDGEKPVREAAIECLSGQNLPAVAEIAKKVIENRGQLGEDDWAAMLKRVEFWMGNSAVEAFRVNPYLLWNNLSWYSLELHNSLNKPALLLESVLAILHRQENADADLAAPLMEIYDNYALPGIQQLCIHLLGNQRQDQERLLPFVMKSLSSPAEPVRKAGVAALNRLDPDWMQRAEIVPALQAMIEALDTGQSESAKAALLSMGTLSAPVLTAYLEQTEKRVLQQTILEILGKLGANAEISLPTLLRVREKCRNTHTLLALNELIKQLGG